MAQPDQPASRAPTAGAAVRSATRRLGAAGIESAARDARLLVSAAMDVGESELILRPDALLGAAVEARLAAMLDRRERHEPVSRILGVREFYGRPFLVTPATLDPRPDSETLIAAALAIIDEEGWRQRPLRLIDVGTGTGCLLLSLLAELPQAHGLGTDVSTAALEVARANANRLGLQTRADFRLQRTLQTSCDRFDMLVCNPPYIPTTDIARLAADVRDYDPGLGLDGGPDGLAVYRELVPRLSETVRGGWAVLEFGAGQAALVSAMLTGRATAAVGPPRVWRDLDGHERCVAIKLQV